MQGIRGETEALGQVVTNFLNFAKPAELTLTPVDMRGDCRARAPTRSAREVRTRGGEVDRRRRVRGGRRRRGAAAAGVQQPVPQRARGVHAGGRRAADRPSRARSDRGQGTLRIAVTDNGPGVDPAVAPTMFRPFFTTKARGTGLGLALVQKIVVTHNGRVTAGNADGGGARLSVTLPLAGR